MCEDFKGSVIEHPAFLKLRESYPELGLYLSAFKVYWKTGFSELIGKDSIMSFPIVYQDNSIGRSHLRPSVFDDKTYSSTEVCWNKWANETSMTVYPTSNTMLLYCVDDQRNSCVISYLDGNDRDAHKVLNDDAFRRNMQDRAQEFFSRMKTNPMPSDQHQNLFSDEWLES